MREAVQAKMDARSKRTEITADAVLQELAKLGFSSLKNLYRDDGKLIPVHELPDDVAATLTEVIEKCTGSGESMLVLERKYKIASKRESLDLLGRHLKLFTDKVDHNHTGLELLNNYSGVQAKKTDKHTEH